MIAIQKHLNGRQAEISRELIEKIRQIDPRTYPDYMYVADFWISACGLICIVKSDPPSGFGMQILGIDLTAAEALEYYKRWRS